MGGLIQPSSSENGRSPIPFYTRIMAFILQLARYCGGLEEMATIFFLLLALAFGVRSRFSFLGVADPSTHRRERRSLLRSPMAVCCICAAIVFRARPRAIRWPLTASDYHILNLNRTLLSPSSPPRSDLQTKGYYFRDQLNRVSILRGVNLGGGSKLPTLPHSGETFRTANTLHVDPAEISFVDRPFPLKDADEHFGRLAAWGLTFLRLQITWEAIEHEGPGIYDKEYLMYLKKLVRKADEYGINVFIDPHQDVWSRYTGGSGAPQWTLEKVGFNVRTLHKSGAAFVHQEWAGAGRGGGSGGGGGGDGDGNNSRPLPGQVWGHNYARAASATMFSLFFGGRDFAPNLMIDGVNVQDYLQNKYCRAMAEVAHALKNENNVVGFDTLNEPNNGFIGFDDLNDVHTPVPFLWDLPPFAFLTMAAGFDHKDVPFYPSPMVYGGTFNMNPEGVSAWTDGPTGCVWRQHGVWDVDSQTGRPILLKPHYFQLRPDGSKIDFMNDYMVPFFVLFAKEIRRAMPTAVIFAEPHINIALAWKEEVEPNLPNVVQFAWVPHYYDLLTLLSKSFRSWIVIDPLDEFLSFDPVKVHAKMIAHQLGKARGVGEGGSAALIGETGICFDHYGGEAYSTTTAGEILPMQTSAFNQLMEALDETLASVTLWNYAPGNTNAHGDGWNEEDLSIFSYDQQNDPQNLHSGGRGLPAIIRPYASRVSGLPILMKFDAKKRIFVLEYDSSKNREHGVQSRETLVFVPQYQYGSNANDLFVVVTDGTWTLDAAKQTIVWKHDENVHVHKMTLRLK